MNPITAFLIVALIYLIGDIVGIITKAWVPSVFVVAVLLITGFWTVLPKDLMKVAGLSMPIALIAMYTCVVHMGSVISIKELMKQWKVIVITIVGLVGMVGFCWFIAAPIVGRDYVVAGLPPLTGGIVAALMMQQTALAKGLQDAAILAVVMYVIQGFAGYPLTAICLKKEGKRLIEKYRNGEIASDLNDSITSQEELASTGKGKLFPPIPKKYNTTNVLMGKMAFISFISLYLSNLTNGKVSGFVICLVLSIIGTEIGFIDASILNKSNSFGFMMFILLSNIFGELSKATPQMIAKISVPLIIIIIIGVTGLAIFSMVGGKFLGISKEMAFAVALTALYGFPQNYILTEEAAKALAKDDDEMKFLMDSMLPQMIVGGFITVTITSVVLAGLFTNLL